MKKITLLKTLLLVAFTILPTVSQTLNVTPSGVGLGTTSPTATLTVTNNDDARLKLYTNGGSIGIIDAVANTNDSTGRWLAINPSGANVGIGITTPSSLLHLNATPAASIQWALQISNQINTTSVDYGSGIKFKNSNYSSNQESNKWAGIAGVAGSSYSNETDLVFYTNTFDGSQNQALAPSERLRVKATTGNVGIGTTIATHKLTVNGVVKSKGSIIDTSNWADYVFTSNYKLKSLDEVEAHIKAKGHLPDVPSEAEIASQGLDVGKMATAQMAQIEQLMLHVIELNKQVKAQAEKIQILEAANRPKEPAR